ncbi:hypothetical protein [Aestuariibacter salexigens]|uniref:hypothetical protein n=1 Tax=Aestuariibacter salexigens TaxID=226010 RepID=UPI00041381D8|nr:hypothetical protein [Aestuariibacter salexigens]
MPVKHHKLRLKARITFILTAVYALLLLSAVSVRAVTAEQSPEAGNDCVHASAKLP